MKNKKRNKLMLLLVLLLAISIGFAALATTLKINGTTNIGKNEWNIYWNRIANQSGVTPKSGPTIENDSLGGVNTQVTFTIDLDTPGDFYEFTVDAVNAGTLDAMIESHGFTLDGNPVSAQNKLPDYVKFSVVYADDGTEIQDKHLLPKATKSGGETTPTRETYKIRVEYDREAVEIDDLDEIDDEGDTYEIGFTVKYSQADNTAIDRHPSVITYLSRQVAGQITPGDVIGIGDTEDFYVISSDSTKTVLLAKYNLLVGFKEYALVGYDEDSNEIWSGLYYTSNDLGYGLQTVDIQEYVSGATQYTFALPFSNTNYWDDGSGNVVSPYNANGASYDEEPYPYIYNSSVTTVPDFSNCEWYDCWSNTPGYSVAYYVEQYKSKLVEMGAPDTIIGRLLSYEEANAVELVKDNDNKSVLFHDKNYWLGSAGASYGVYGVITEVESISYYDYDMSFDNTFGVRPVIEINTSDIPE